MQQLETMDLVLSASGALIALMLGVIGWFLKKFSTTVDKLTDTVDQLKLVISVEQERLKSTKEILQATTSATEARVSSLELIVNQHDKDIAVLKNIYEKRHEEF